VFECGPRLLCARKHPSRAPTPAASLSILTRCCTLSGPQIQLGLSHTLHQLSLRPFPWPAVLQRGSARPAVLQRGSARPAVLQRVCKEPLPPPVQERLAHLRRVRGVGDVNEVMFAVRADLIRNLGNMTNRWGRLMMGAGCDGCWVLAVMGAGCAARVLGAACDECWLCCHGAGCCTQLMWVLGGGCWGVLVRGLRVAVDCLSCCWMGS
jgi:hypothetical protein